MALVKMNFLSKMLNMQTNITICLPSYSFADSQQKKDDVYVPGMKYQVLWLLHGYTGDDSDYVNFTNIVRYADDHKLAVVMPPAYNASYTDNPEGAKYFKFVTEELPQMCRVMFPFSDKREDNFVAGLSMGGMGTFKCAVMHSELYAAALCMSGAGFDPDKMKDHPMFKNRDIKGTEDDPWTYAKIRKEEGREMPKFFFTCGDKDFALEGVRSTKDYMISLGYDVFYEEVPGYAHEWDFWDLTLRKAIKEWLPIRHSAIYPEK